MAETLAAERLRVMGTPSVVYSRGVVESARDARPAHPSAVKALRRQHLDLTDHRSAVLTEADLAHADLVLAMERRHLVQIAELNLDAVHRSFTVPELAMLAVDVGSRPADESIHQWIALADGRRDRSQVLVGTSQHNVPDPTGGPPRAFRRTARELDRLLGEIFANLFPDRRST